MELKEYIQSLKDLVDKRLTEIDINLDPLARQRERVVSISEALGELRSYMRGHTFETDEAEILYHKHLAPPLYSQLVIHVKRLAFEKKKLTQAADRMEEYLLGEMKDINCFLDLHEEFYSRYVLGETRSDLELFTRRGWDHMHVHELSLVLGLDSCPGFVWITQIMAYLELREYWAAALVNYQKGGGSHAEMESTLIWTDSKADWYELVYGIFLKGSFNHGKAEIKTIAKVLSRPMGVNYKVEQEIYSGVQELARRKKDPVKYVSALERMLRAKFEEMN